MTKLKKILVTGASGYVGGQLCIYLTKNINYEVLGIGRHIKAYSFNFSFQDLTEEFSDEIYNFNPDIIVHCAAKSSPWGTYSDFFLNNVTATQNVVNFAKQIGAKLIHISTGAIYYEKKHQYKIKEASTPPIKKINHYAETKFIAEQIVVSQLKDYVILRPRAIFGEYDTVIFPRVMAAKKIPKPKQDIVLSDVLYIDNFNYYVEQSIINDVVGIFNINNQEEVCLHNFIEKLMSAMGRKMRTIQINSRLLFTIAKCFESTYRILNIQQEPPLTEFGVCVLLYSKTFDYTKAKKTFGTPPFNNEESIRKYSSWLIEKNII